MLLRTVLAAVTALTLQPAAMQPVIVPAEPSTPRLIFGPQDGTSFSSTNASTKLVYSTSPSSYRSEVSFTASGPCRVSHGFVFPKTVTNGQGSQRCTVTAALFGQKISRTFTVLSNERLSGNTGCVAECRWYDGIANFYMREPANPSVCWRILINGTTETQTSFLPTGPYPCPGAPAPSPTPPKNPTPAPKPTPTTTTPKPAAQSITFNPPTPVLEHSTHQVTAIASSGLPVKLTHVSGNCTVWGTTMKLFDVGECVLQATQAGNASFLPASVQRTVKVVCSEALSCPRPVARNDFFPFEHGEMYIGNVGENDEWLGTGSFKLVSSSTPELSLSRTGRLVFTPTRLFTGEVTLRYRLTDSMNRSVEADARVRVRRPDPPAAPVITPTASITAPKWMRLNTNEKFSFSVSAACNAPMTSTARCGTHPDANPYLLAGAYAEIATTLTNATLTPPAGYPANRYTFTKPRTGSFSSASNGTARFSQATSGGKTFSLQASIQASIRQVQWVRNTDGTVVNVTEVVTPVPLTASASFGVVGSTR